MPEVIYLTGLPRSGSTLMCNLLAAHPEVGSTPSSPLCNIIQNMRRNWSDDPFLLSQLDSNFDDVYKRLHRSLVSFIQAWSSDNNESIVIDKNRGWLACVEFLRDIYPKFKMIVCLRDLEAVYGSVEKQHRKTLLLDYPDHMEHNLVDVRARQLFDDGGIIGHPLKALYNIGDVPDIAPHLYYVRFEDLLEKQQKVMDAIFEWIEVKPVQIDFDNIRQVTFENDAFYRHKYPHLVHPKLISPNSPPISPRIIKAINERFEWFYQLYYPEKISGVQGSNQKIEDRIAKEIESEIQDGLDDEIIEQLEKAIEDETR